MFGDKDSRQFPDVGNFPSSWRSDRSVTSGSCQTSSVEFRESYGQSVLFSEAGTQTDQAKTKTKLSKEELEVK